METFAKLFERFLVFVYHCFDRIVIQGYLPLLTRPEHIVHFFRDVHGLYPITPQVLAKRTPEYRAWVEGLRPQPQNPDTRARRRAKARRTSSGLICNGWSVGITTGFTSSSRAWKWAARSLLDAEVSYRRSGLPHHPARPVTLPALLLLHPRSGDRPSGDVRRHVPSLSDNVLPERPQLHRDRTAPPGSHVSQGRQRVPFDLRPAGTPERRRQVEPCHHRKTAELLDLAFGSQVLRKGSQGRQPRVATTPSTKSNTAGTSSSSGTSPSTRSSSAPARWACSA